MMNSCPVKDLVLLQSNLLFLLLQGVSKGLVVEKILSSMMENGRQADFVLCIGDDRSDEDMFEDVASIVSKNLVARHSSIFGCTVGQKPSKAKYYLDDITDVISMLGALADASEDSPSSPDALDEPSSSPNASDKPPLSLEF